MRERPIQDLVDGLRQLGVDAECPLGTGCPPVTINARGLPTGTVRSTQRQTVGAFDVVACRTLLPISAAPGTAPLANWHSARMNR